MRRVGPSGWVGDGSIFEYICGGWETHPSEGGKTCWESEAAGVICIPLGHSFCLVKTEWERVNLTLGAGLFSERRFDARSRVHTCGETDRYGYLIAKVLANTRVVDDGADAEGLELIFGTNARVEHDLRSVCDSSREDKFFFRCQSKPRT